MTDLQHGPDLTDLTAELVSAYVANNNVPVSDLPALLHSVHTALSRLDAAPATELPPPEVKPAVPIKKSVTDDHIVCLEDGLKFKSLKRHLGTAHGITPAQYREKWGLPRDYPFVASGYQAKRSAMAKTLGLGRKPFGTKS